LNKKQNFYRSALLEKLNKPKQNKTKLGVWVGKLKLRVCPVTSRVKLVHPLAHGNAASPNAGVLIAVVEK
jgi:hypothetical protein